MVDDIPSTYGALVIGSLFAFFLSGAVTLQTLYYFHTFTADLLLVKLMVLAVWMIDLGHSALVATSIWHYVISYFGNTDHLDIIPWSIPLTIVLTALLTLLVHGFFALRIYKLSGRKWYLVVPVIILALARCAAASITTAQMLRIKTLSGFVAQFRWVFTLGLGLSSGVDVLIAALLCFFLLRSRSSSASMQGVIDSLILYSFETGALTTAATIVSMVCWLLMPHNLIFMGLHFVISKLYANSLLASLNTRKSLRRKERSFSMIQIASPPAPSEFRKRSTTFSQHVPLPSGGSQRSSKFYNNKDGSQVHINVEKTIEYEVEGHSFYIHKPITPLPGIRPSDDWEGSSSVGA